MIIPAQPGYTLLVYLTNLQDKPSPEGHSNGSSFAYPIIAWRIQEDTAHPIFAEYSDLEVLQEEIPGYTRRRYLQTPAGIFDLDDGANCYSTRSEWEDSLDDWALNNQRLNAAAKKAD